MADKITMYGLTVRTHNGLDLQAQPQHNKTDVNRWLAGWSDPENISLQVHSLQCEIVSGVPICDPDTAKLVGDKAVGAKRIMWL